MRLRELELLQDKTGMEKCGKLKLKHGGPLDVLVKHMVA